MTSRSVVLVLMMAVQASAAYAQDASVLDPLRQALGGSLPKQLRVTAAGSAYVPADGESGTRQHVRIQTFAQEFDLAAPKLAEEAVMLDMRPGAPQPTRTAARVADTSSAWTDQYALWTTPAGFLAGATARAPQVATETLFGRPYRVVTFTTSAGREVRGYLNEENVLERTRTEIEQPGRGTVSYEATFLDWRDFGGVKYPNVIIQKENDELARILIVDAVEVAGSPGGGATSAAAR